jgi:hypothetical protein
MAIKLIMRGLLLLLLAFGCHQINVDMPVGDVSTATVPDVVHRRGRSKEDQDLVALCRKLTPYHTAEYRELLTDLAARGEYDSLAAIYNSEFTFSGWAAAEACRAMPTTKAVDFCSSLEPGSKNWMEAFLALQYHPKELVIDYVLQTAHDRNPRVRYFCYILCTIHRWPEAADCAEKDLDNDFVVVLPNEDENLFLSTRAATYLRLIGRSPARATGSTGH